MGAGVPRGRTESFKVRGRNPDRVRYPDVGQLTALAELVHGRGADAESGRYLSDAEQVVRAYRDPAKSRGQGGDKLLANLSISLRRVGLGGPLRPERKRRFSSRCEPLDALGRGLIPESLRSHLRDDTRLKLA